MNLTLSADADVIQRARAAALRQGRSLNDVLRETRERLAGVGGREAAAAEFLQLATQHGGVLDGPFRREDAYDRGRRA